ncbi:MAG: molecular chaperone DnaJ [Rivularia sp. (in: cyanobacteria)]
MEKNPYLILGVSQAASKAEITKAVAAAMKRKEYSVDVIAKAQRSLIKPNERIIADYLCGILPTIKRFKYNDLSALEQPQPILTLLSEFDGLDMAIAKAVKEENLEKEPLTMSLSELLVQGISACKQKRYPKAIKYLEDYCENSNDCNSKDYAQAQVWLVKAYQVNGQLHRALSVCQLLTSHPNSQVQVWANKCLELLSKKVPALVK